MVIPPTSSRSAQLVFRVGTRWYALATAAVQQIVEVQPVVLVPGSPDFIRGVINLAGRITAVLDLDLLLGTPTNKSGEPEVRFLVVSAQDTALVFPTHAIAELQDVPEEELATFSFQGQPVQMLDADRLLALSEAPPGGTP